MCLVLEFRLVTFLVPHMVFLHSKCIYIFGYSNLIRFYATLVKEKVLYRILMGSIRRLIYRTFSWDHFMQVLIQYFSFHLYIFYFSFHYIFWTKQLVNKQNISPYRHIIPFCHKVFFKIESRTLGFYIEPYWTFFLRVN